MTTEQRTWLFIEHTDDGAIIECPSCGRRVEFRFARWARWCFSHIGCGKCHATSWAPTVVSGPEAAIRGRELARREVEQVVQADLD